MHSRCAWSVRSVDGADPARDCQSQGGDAFMPRETAFTMDTSSIKYGPGVSREVGHDIGQWGVRRAMVVTDPFLAGGAAVTGVIESLRAAGIDAVLFDRVRVEPTDASLLEAVDFAREG